MATLEQKIAQKEDELARLKAQSRKLENGQKIITGGMVLSLARNNPQRAKTLLEDIKSQVIKKTDLERMQPIIDELTAIVDKANEQQNNYL
ncbi:mobilization protein [Psychrobacter sp. PP-21]|jgi:flagellin-specific chaperone FliS|uniref:mobilization protein n=1 Tax=Psychrobacter sp. PP-21 TaxID=2957503 RepID=UPI0029A97FA3|nr:mobilization protein [Psychrobacter sp. PP-21]MDX2375102.1 mobilization protein [Psychrobacter sp. PP-21]